MKENETTHRMEIQIEISIDYVHTIYVYIDDICYNTIVFQRGFMDKEEIMHNIDKWVYLAKNMNGNCEIKGYVKTHNPCASLFVNTINNMYQSDLKYRQ